MTSLTVYSLNSYSLVVLIGYLLGSLNLATLLAKLKGVDLRAGGSGNPGTANTVSLMGWKAGVLVGAHDIGKAILAVWLCMRLFPDLPYCGAVAGVACVLGHIFPFYMGFRGGKGFAAYLGMTAALNWRFALGLLRVLPRLLCHQRPLHGRAAAVRGLPGHHLQASREPGAHLPGDRDQGPGCRKRPVPGQIKKQEQRASARLLPMKGLLLA